MAMKLVSIKLTGNNLYQVLILKDLKDQNSSWH